ncbi:MAG TPA: hypothetical protein VF607_17325 [Verrucomicrobiae bacterium]
MLTTLIHGFPGWYLALILYAGLSGGACAAETNPPAISGDAIIRAPAGASEIVIKTSTRMAGAIESLQWDGQEFINKVDHGRELQTAWNGDAGQDPIFAEVYNPTEAGSRDDSAGSTSSSRLLNIQAHGNQLTTLSQPAFWLSPGATSGGQPARNKTILSPDRLRKMVVIGYQNLPHAIDYQVTISLAPENHNRQCVMEALTGYMPPEFSRFYTFDPATAKLSPLTDGPGEQALPVVFATADGKYAMGILAITDPGAAPAGRGPTYGRWRFTDFGVVKWNCVYRLNDTAGLSGDYRYHLIVAVGALENVRSTFQALTRNR